MMHWARFIVLVFSLYGCATVFAQELLAPDKPQLHLYLETDRSVWLELYMPDEPKEPERVSQALGELVAIESPQELADIYDGFDEDVGASWSTYWYPDLNPTGLLVSGELELESVRSALTELGLSEILVVIQISEGPVASASWQEPSLAMVPTVDGFEGKLPLTHPIPSLSIAYGFTPFALLGWYVPVLLCFVPLLAYAWFLRYAALKRPEDEAGAACFYCTRRSLNSIIMFCIVLLPVLHLTDSLLPFAYYWGEEWPVIPEYRVRMFLFLTLGTLGALAARMIVFPVYARFPDATWTRRDFIVQCLWACGFVGVVLVSGSLVIGNLAYNPPRALALLVVAFVAGSFAWRQFIFSLGFEIQALEEGELRERVDSMAAAAGVPVINGVYLLYMTKAPVLNAFAASSMRVLFTDFLLRRLTRREVDAVIAHELTHLKLKHPSRLQRTAILCCYVLPAVGGIVSLEGLQYLGMRVSLPEWTSSSSATTGVIALFMLLGHLYYWKRSRRFEQEADDGALMLADDPEAHISGFVKLARMNHMPMIWGGSWSERFVTHPSTELRARRVAARGNLSDDRLVALLAGESTGGEYYPIPSSAARGGTTRMRLSSDEATDEVPRARLFNTQHKIRILQLSGFAFLLLPALAATAVACLWSIALGTAPAWAAVAIGALYSLILCVLFQNRAAVQGFAGLARRMRQNFADELGDAPAHFVSFCPNGHARLYDGYTNWDVGLLPFNDAGLHYLGDATEFTIPRSDIDTISLETRWSFYIPAQRIRVTWRDAQQEGLERVFTFWVSDARSLLGLNRATRRLHQSLRAWHEGQGALNTAHRISPRPAPEKLDVKGLRGREIPWLSAMLLSGFKTGICGFAVAHAIGLPALEPLASSASGVALAAGLSMPLLNLPMWLDTLRHPDP